MSQSITSPPLGLRHCPTKWRASSEARNTYAGTISSTVARRRLGIEAISDSIKSLSMPSTIRVCVAPGATQLAVMLLVPISCESERVNAIIPALAAQ
jgi:hypothetical protein